MTPMKILINLDILTDPFLKSEVTGLGMIW